MGTAKKIRNKRQEVTPHPLRLKPAECVAKYAKAFLSENQNFVLVTDDAQTNATFS